MIRFNNKIKEARTEKGMTQKQLAEELTKMGHKTSNTAIANWESGLNKPDIDTLEAICIILEKDGNYFFDTLGNSFRYASHNRINTEGLDENDMEEVNNYVEFVRNKKKKNKED